MPSITLELNFAGNEYNRANNTFNADHFYGHPQYHPKKTKKTHTNDKPQPYSIKDIQNILSRPPSPKPTSLGPVISSVDEILNEARNAMSQVSETPSFSKFEIAVLVALGIALAPEAIVAAGSTILTAITLGPVADGLTLELLANPPVIEALRTAGLVVGEGKLLNFFGMFAPASRKTAIVAEQELKGMTVQNVVDKAIALGVKTPPNSLSLWSGLGEERLKISQDFALSNNLMTLEMTKGGAWLENLNLFSSKHQFNAEEVQKIWEGVSLHAMKLAEGKVTAITGIVKEGSIFNKEVNALMANEKFTYIDEIKMIPRIVSSRP